MRAKVWSKVEVRRVSASFEDRCVDLQPVPGSKIWEGNLPIAGLPNAIYSLQVKVEDGTGQTAEDSIRVLIGNAAPLDRKRFDRDQDNAISAWVEHGLLGTQLGPNKNGRKW